MTRPDASLRLAEAVRILDEDQGTLRERLLTAFVSQLLEIDPRYDLPERLQEPFQRLRIQLTQDEVVGDTGNVTEALERMSDDQVRDIAQQIVNLSQATTSGDAPAPQPRRP